MVSTELGMVIEVRLRQSPNVLTRIIVIELEIVTEVRLVHSVYLQLIVYQLSMIKTVEK